MIEQDRVLFHRLEHICYCVEHNEWPFPKRMSYIPMNYDSRSGTPVGSMTSKEDPDLSQSDAGDSVYDGVKVMSDLDKDFEVMMSEVGHRFVRYECCVFCWFAYMVEIWAWYFWKDNLEMMEGITLFSIVKWLKSLISWQGFKKNFLFNGEQGLRRSWKVLNFLLRVLEFSFKCSDEKKVDFITIWNKNLSFKCIHDIKHEKENIFSGFLCLKNSWHCLYKSYWSNGRTFGVFHFAVGDGGTKVTYFLLA